ncbi:phage terminase small subunit [Sphingomonas sp. RS6]
MSPARQHRERFAAMARPDHAEPIVAAPRGEGGQQTPPVAAPATPARLHALQHAALAASADEPGGADPALGSGPDAQIMLRLVHDMRRLKGIQSIERKVEAKREMLPAYRDWVRAHLQAAAETGTARAEEVIPTIMVWLIDVGEYQGAIELAEHLLHHDLPMPARYQRSTAALVAEEIASAALKAQAAGEHFDLDILFAVESLTEDADMHDQIRAKLFKAIGMEMAARAEIELPANERARANARALDALRRAKQLDDRVGVKGRIRQVEKLLDAPAPEPAPDQGA